MIEKDLESMDDTEYIDFVIKRLASTDYDAESKLKEIDELADIIFLPEKVIEKANHETLYRYR